MNREDFATFAELGAVGKKCTGYEPTSQTSTQGQFSMEDS